MLGPMTLADLPDYLRHRLVVAADARELHPHPADLQRRIVALEERVAGSRAADPPSGWSCTSPNTVRYLITALAT